MRIAFLTSGNPGNKRSWSGIDYYMANALREHCGDVFYPGDVTPARRVLAGKILNRAAETLLHRKYSYLHSAMLARGYAQNISKRLAGEGVDLLFVPSDSTLAAFLETDLPLVYLSGATFALMRSYYPQYSRLLGRSIREGNLIEQRCIDRARLLLYASEWAAGSAVRDYGASPSKVHVLPYGANLDAEDVPPREAVLARRLRNPCRLLFLGVDWQRKGGKIAFDTLLALEGQGVAAELIVCGCTPPPEFTHPQVRTIPYLDKNDPGQRRQLAELLMSASFLFLPTRSECFGAVFCEASAFGLPSVTTDTGGVSGAVRDGENGFLLPLSAGGRDYAEVIGNVLQEEKTYLKLVRSSREAFEGRLNWDAWGGRVRQILEANL